jgi:purine-cytosine permease-like protein
MIEYFRTLLQAPLLGLFVPVYAVLLLVHWFMNRREFKRCPEKGARYRALPLVYKFACWFIVLPMFAGGLIDPAWFIPAIVAYMLVEGACVRWYKKAGMF